MEQSPKTQFHVVVKESEPSPENGYNYQHSEKSIDHNFKDDIMESGPSPGEGHNTEAKPFMMVQSPKTQFHGVVKESGPSPGNGNDYQHSEKSIDHDFKDDIMESCPSPGEGHK
ncbi:hypothetical protein HAX54_013777 [Datura stramonium]|uniref:Uncharacterized protein n=1 Tax=Datura stramonium TaxID=4076 RepID=A0ABS8TNN7_DATST|nr:hypothetical protein [Datura stramonium]